MSIATAYKLQDAGFSKQQVEALGELVETQAATKADLAEVKAELKADIAGVALKIERMAGGLKLVNWIAVTALGILVAIALKLFLH